MKKLFIMFALVVGAATVKAQGNDLFQGVTQKFLYGQMVVPYGVQVTFAKTVHIIFPSTVKYVDLGSPHIIAGKADGAENIIRVKNSSTVPIDTDFIKFKVVDKKVAKRTAVQESVLYPVRSFNEVIIIGGKSTVRTVYTLPKFTILDHKILVVELVEKNGGRHQNVWIENSDVVNA